jgi:vacuolar-type H+-ATPase subunit H
MTSLAERFESQQPVTAEDAKEAAKEKGQEVRTQASERLRQEVDQRSSQAGEQVQSFAQTMRRTAAELRAQGQQGQGGVFDQVAMRAEQLGGYLTEADADQLLDQLKSSGRSALDFARQQPALVGIGGLGIGIVASRLLRRGGESESSGSGG